MVEVALWYGRETLRARFPDRSFVIGARQPGEGARTQTREERMEAVRRALQNPLERPRLRKMVAPGASVVIAFDDPTVRGSGDIRELIIEACLEELAEAGVDERNVRLICANALHRKFTRDELAQVIGSSLAERFADRLVCHDAEDWENLVSFGQTPNGHWVDLNRAAVEADLLVYVNAGCVLGFSGGWKSIVVGLSTWRSIKSTHHPDGMSMSIAHNRMHAVFEEMAELLPESLRSRIFKVETVMDGPEAVAGVWAGSIPAARAAALAFLAARNPPRRAAAPARVDVVAYGVADASPYAVFARPNPILTLISSGLGYQGGYIEALGKPGCTVIMATPVRDEWDLEHHPSYPEVWQRVLAETRDAYEIDRKYAEAFAQRADYIERYRFGVAFHPVHGVMATQPLKRLRHAGQVIVAGAEDPQVPRYLGFETAESVEEAVRMAQRVHGEECSFAVIGPTGDTSLAPRAERLRS